MTYRTVDNSIA